MTDTKPAAWRSVLVPSFQGYRPSWLRADLIAGLTVWAVLVPESLAYAGIAGVPPVVGLYAAVPALLLYALLGSSRHLVVAPMSATAALSLGVVGDLTTDPGEFIAFTTALALSVGLAALLAGVLRLGFLASFISEPVLKGFIIGLALGIMIGQLPAMFGVEKGDGNFFEKAWALLGNLPDLDPLTTVVGVGSLVLLLVLRRWLPILPGSLIVAALGIVLVALLDLDEHGVAIVGHIDSGLPSIGLPDIQSTDFFDILAGSVGVMLVGFAEGLGAAKTYAAKQGYEIDSNKELVGLGAANLGAGLCSGMVVNGSLSKTAVNGAAGARSQISGVTTAALTVATLLFLTGLFEQLPEATLSAIVVAAVIELVDIAALRRLWRVANGPVARTSPFTRRADFFAAIAALLGVLVFDTLPGLVIGIAVSLALLIARTSRPYIAVLVPTADPGPGRPTLWVDARRHPTATPVPGVLVLRVEGPLLFVSADFVREQVRVLAAAQHAGGGSAVRAVVIDGEASPGTDVTAAAMLTELRDELDREGVALGIASGTAQLRDVLTEANDDQGPPMFTTIEAAIAELAPGAGGFTRNG